MPSTPVLVPTTSLPKLGDMTTPDVRRQIDAALLDYCRGIDGLDPELVATAFHPGAVLSGYGGDPMDIDTFADVACTSLQKRFTATQHRISNTAVDFAADGASASVETYVTADHIKPTEAGDVLHAFTGRYIDRFEERDGAWKITTRALRHDWSEIRPLGEPMRGEWVPADRTRRAAPSDSESGT